MADIELTWTGCGDGAISLHFAKTKGVRCVGFDIDLVHLSTARKKAADYGVSQLLEFKSDDIFEVDFSPASVLVMFLVPNMLTALVDKLRAMPPGTRIISYHYPLPSWEPKEVHDAAHPHHPPPALTSIYFYLAA